MNTGKKRKRILNKEEKRVKASSFLLGTEQELYD